MNKYNPHIHHRRSIRLKGYDYSQAGLYFITICCQDRACLFGKIKNGILQLNDAGRMVEKWYRELENKFPDIRCREMIVMPNHFHCIIENTGTPVGADLRVCPSPSPSPNPQSLIPGPEQGTFHRLQPVLTPQALPEVRKCRICDKLRHRFADKGATTASWHQIGGCPETHI